MNWKVFFAFIAGGITGGLGTWYGVREYYRKEARKEIAEMNDWYREKLKEAENTRTVVVDGVTDKAKDEVETFLKENSFDVVASEDGPEKKEKRDGAQAKKQYENLVRQYDKMYKEKPSLEELKASMEHPDDDINTEDYVEFTGETDEQIEVVKEPHPDTLPGPVIIPEEEYANDWRFEKCAITYYIGDETLADEDETMIDDVEYTVSWEALRILVEEDLDAVYVRNEKLGIDYEITPNARKYSEEVLGLFDEEEDEVGGRIPMKKRKEKPSDDE